MKAKRVYVEKRAGFDVEARRLRSELAGFLGSWYPELGVLKSLRILNRYDVLGLDDADFEAAVSRVFSEPQCDGVFFSDRVPSEKGDGVFAAEFLPGQYNQRAHWAEQCVELGAGKKPRVRQALVYILSPGEMPLSPAALDGVKRYLINPVDSREASPDPSFSPGDGELFPPDVPVLRDFLRGDLDEIARLRGLAMSPEDLRFCRDYFMSLGRNPTLTELRVLDTYWSDHCRHTTFTTELEDMGFEEGVQEGLKRALDLYEEARREVYGPEAAARKRTLMDMATIGAKVLKKRGLLGDLDESKEINACSVAINADFAGSGQEPWLLLFKNETHNHPTEIEPFGGAATCLGGAIRDPLSGRAYVHQAMRISGGGDPRVSPGETLPGKLPQVKIAREAAGGYSSYGNQIGIATGQVAEFYHPGFLAKRLELGAVIAAVPRSWVRREEPAPGDLVILVGGGTGRDGIGGATGSSKVHTGESVQSAGAEVQKGNAVEERKLQRLFRDPRTIGLIKRCNDFGAGGVAVAVGELAAGLDIDLDAVPKKYAGLDGTELAISESQERMAVVTAPEDAGAFIRAAAAENLDAVVIARVSAGDGADGVLRMTWRGKTVVELSRSFLNTNGAPRSARVRLSQGSLTGAEAPSLSAGALLDNLEQELSSLRSCGRRGLQERFDGSIGASSVLFPWGGGEQGTPECGMAALLPALGKRSLSASLMTFGYDPELGSRSPYAAAKGAVREALAKFACLGGDPWTARLSLQEYFERPRDPLSWGRPAAALLGALEAQLALGVPAIGGKDSMSGNYRDQERGLDLAVPPSLAAFAAGITPAAKVRSGALSGEPGNAVILLHAGGGANSEEAAKSEWEVFRANMNALTALSEVGMIKAAYPVGAGGAAASLAVMAFGSLAGVEAAAAAFSLAGGPARQGSVLAELSGDPRAEALERVMGGPGPCWALVARTIGEPVFRVTTRAGDRAEVSLRRLRRAYEEPLSRVYPLTSAALGGAAEAGGELKLPGMENPERKKGPGPRPRGAAPLTILPVFPGTNCEWDMERAFQEAGSGTRQVVFRNRRPEDIRDSIAELVRAIGEAQIIALSGGFSAGDEPDGSGKFIANLFRQAAVAEAVTEFLEKRDGLILGICNGFQALIKLGLVPYGKILAPGETMPTLTFNSIGRHVSRMVRTRVMPNISPWLSREEEGALHVLPVSHGEGRIAIRAGQAENLFKAGQVPFCYADSQGRPTLAEPDNPNGSAFAIEGLCSPDGRVLGKMAHSERAGDYVHVNIPGNKKQRLFEAAIAWFS